jgi:hypothetical protein
MNQSALTKASKENFSQSSNQGISTQC